MGARLAEQRYVNEAYDSKKKIRDGGGGQPHAEAAVPRSSGGFGTTDTTLKASGGRLLSLQ